MLSWNEENKFWDKP